MPENIIGLTLFSCHTKIVSKQLKRGKMKNVTITLSEDVAAWARVWAAKRNSSVSRLVGELLKQKMLDESNYKTAMNQFLSRKPTELKKSGRYPSREELHER